MRTTVGYFFMGKIYKKQPFSAEELIQKLESKGLIIPSKTNAVNFLKNIGYYRLWHVLIRLPNGLLFDGGIGVHSEEKYRDKFDIEDMRKYAYSALTKGSYHLGLIKLHNSTVLRESLMLDIISSPLLNKIPNLKHGMFTRNGGVSSGYYSSLNCNFEGNDNISNVRENIRRAMEHISCSSNSLVSINCIHGKEVVIVDKVWREHERPKADAMVTNKPGIVLGSDSADCPIILLVDDKAAIIAWVHAGWRSAKAGVIEETLKKMQLLGASSRNISATICPCIEQKSYEVDLEFYKLFIEEHSSNNTLFKPTQKLNHKLFDLKAYVKNRLATFDLKGVSVMDYDTYSDATNFFSCRRARHNAESDFGGNLSFISLNSTDSYRCRSKSIGRDGVAGLA